MARSTVGHLKELIKDLPDDVELVTTAFDHTYRSVIPDIVEAEFGGGREYYEYAGLEYMASSYNPVKLVLLFS
jgi:hypothetical protein